MKNIRTLVIIALVIASSAFAWNANRRSKMESYGASPYGSFAAELLGYFPPEYRSRDSVLAVLDDTIWQLRQAAANHGTDAVPCATVFQYVDLEASLSRIPIGEAWNLRKSVATLKRMFGAVSGENCLGGYTTFGRAADQLETLAAAF